MLPRFNYFTRKQQLVIAVVIVRKTAEVEYIHWLHGESVFSNKLEGIYK